MLEQYIFREARLQDLSAIGRIFDDAVAKMLSEGKTQWDENYPTEAHALADIRSHNGYVMEYNGMVVAYGAVVFSGEPAFDRLRGEWLSDGPYVVVHRMAVAMSARRQGIGRRFIAAVEKLALSKGVTSFRIDTNHDNDRMLALLETAGFEYCGGITYPTGDRLAFEKLL